MVALSLAIVDRNNRPLYLEEFADPQSSLSSLSSSLSPPPPPSDEEMMGVGGFLAESPSVHDSGGGGVGGRCSIRFQFILQAALDRMDNLASLPFDGTRDGMFLGLLMPVEEMRVYGYVTSSKTKILVVVEDDALPEIQKSTDEEIKRLLVNVHSLYVADLMNPFQEIGSPIVSAKFRAAIQQSVAAFNQSDGL